MEPEFIFPDWISNSDFSIEKGFTVANPGDPTNDYGFTVFESVITNDCLRITMTYEILDSQTCIAMGLTPKSAVTAGTNIWSRRYLFHHTYHIENISGVPLSDVKLFQFMHGLETDTSIYDDRNYGGPYADYCDDNHFSPKPTIGVHLSVEANALDGTDFFAPPEKRWVGGAQRFDLGSLAPSATVTEDVLLTIASTFEVAYDGIDIAYHEMSFTGGNEFLIRFEEEGRPLQFKLWKATEIGPFDRFNCSGDDCDWTPVSIPMFFNPAEPEIKWFSAPYQPWGRQLLLLPAADTHHAAGIRLRLNLSERKAMRTGGGAHGGSVGVVPIPNRNPTRDQ